jgi:hypothetical protein
MNAVKATALVCLALAACRGGSGGEVPASGDAAPLHAAVDSLTSVIVYDIFSPPQASRVYAYSSVASYEVARQADTAFRSLAGQLRGLDVLPRAEAGVSLDLASVHAFLVVGRALTFSRARMDTILTHADRRWRGLPRDVYDRSIAYGDTVAAHVLAWAGTDGYRESRGMPKYTVQHRPGFWIPTPPAYMDAVEPNWGTLRPFVLDSARQFEPAVPHTFSVQAASPFMRGVQEVYTVGRQLTDEQRAIAAFWDCNPYVMNVQGHTMFATKKITPGGHWMGIVGLASRRTRSAMPRAAEAYARASIALADGFLSAWDAKYRTHVVRPETVINASLDPEWKPLLQTPPFPEYTSGHSVISNAAAEVLSDVFGDSLAFSDSTELSYGLPVRSFRSFREAAAEAAVSRLYGGIHFRQAIEEGSVQGRRVGELHVARVRTRGSRMVAIAPGVR